MTRRKLAEVFSTRRKLGDIYQYSTRHKKSILESPYAGCFFCKTLVPTRDITEWVHEDQTAICPKCGVDSLLPDNQYFPITPELLQIMYEEYFTAHLRD